VLVGDRRLKSEQARTAARIEDANVCPVLTLAAKGSD
jgi:hypothetical protein